MKRTTPEQAAELARLCEVHGRLTPALVLDAAEDPESPLHAAFTWDDEKAAVAHRHDQARRLITSVRVEIQPRATMRPIKVRAYASLPSDRTSGGGYRPMTEILKQKDLRAELLRAAILEMEAFKRRYNQFSELAKVFAAMEGATREYGGFGTPRAEHE